MEGYNEERKKELDQKFQEKGSSFMQFKRRPNTSKKRLPYNNLRKTQTKTQTSSTITSAK
jgi:hypothetical protein